MAISKKQREEAFDAIYEMLRGSGSPRYEMQGMPDLDLGYVVLKETDIALQEDLRRETIERYFQEGNEDDAKRLKKKLDYCIWVPNFNGDFRLRWNKDKTKEQIGRDKNRTKKRIKNKLGFFGGPNKINVLPVFYDDNDSAFRKFSDSEILTKQRWSLYGYTTDEIRKMVDLSWAQIHVARKLVDSNSVVGNYRFNPETKGLEILRFSPVYANRDKDPKMVIRYNVQSVEQIKQGYLDSMISELFAKVVPIDSDKLVRAPVMSRIYYGKQLVLF